MSRIRSILTGTDLTSRAMRSSALTVFGYGASQVLRLASNLILTRMLYPEAFGIMALVLVVMQGLFQFSDVGISPSIMQSKRGDDPDFLNTAWTIQLMRGVGLWIAATALAIPFSVIYDAPQLAQLLPVAAFSLLVTGFNPTRLDTANRHLMHGRVTVIDLATQTIGIITAVLFAWWLQSVWALVISGIIGAVAQLFMYNAFLPGERNRLRWEPAAAKELITFGKWIFLSTLCGFLFSQGDKVILGKFLSLDLLGVYNIGYFLASFPLLLGGTVIRRILIPLYRERPPRESAENFKQARKARFGLTAFILALLMPIALFGVWLIDVMYDPRYAAAGAIVVLVACVQIPQVIIMTYDQAALAAGDSRRFFVLAATKAAALIAALLIGVQLGGLYGALLSQLAAMAVIYPVAVWLAVRQGVWDPLHDVFFAVTGVVLSAIVIWHNADAVAQLARASGVVP